VLSKYLVFDFEGTGVAARAILLEKEAPRTCKAVWERLPYAGPAGHAMHSGTICALYIDPAIVAPVENASSHVLPGDVVFVHYDVMERHGYPGALSEICWAYDRYVRPMMPGMLKPICPNIFARLLPGQEAFMAMSGRLRRESVKPIRITGASD
jgi:hypothetical protein